MGKGRLEAFSDGVIAIIITVMVLELRAPAGGDWSNLLPLASSFVSYVLSFVFLGIYWNNHHHLLQAAEKVNGSILWANLHLLFWLSLIPFVTAWMGQNHFAPAPVALYGVDQICAAVAYYLLVHALLAHHGPKSKLAMAIGNDIKGKISLTLYGTAVGFAFFLPAVSLGIYILVAVIWLAPDRRIEKVLLK